MKGSLSRDRDPGRKKGNLQTSLHPGLKKEKSQSSGEQQKNGADNIIKRRSKRKKAVGRRGKSESD